MSTDDPWTAPKSPYLVPSGERFKISKAPTEPREDVDKDAKRAELEEHVAVIRELQKRLHADNRYAVLFVFQAMDAAGKDSTIRAVFTGVNPAGFQVYNFVAPSDNELDHDFLWRVASRMPERGRIGVFNRSHYEEVLVVRVHPEFLEKQRLPRISKKKIWKERLESIRDAEQHLARNGTVVVKFFLNVSLEQQKRRLLRRIDNPSRNWKFNPNDVAERERWPEYMEAYEEAINETSRPWAPWYVIPADSKPFMRVEVARIIKHTLESLGLDFPEVSEETRAALAGCRVQLENE